MYTYIAYENVINHNILNITFFFNNFFSLTLDYVTIDNMFFFDPNLPKNQYYYFDYTKRKPFFFLENPLFFDLGWGPYKVSQTKNVLNNKEEDPFYIFIKNMRNTKWFLYLKNCELANLYTKNETFITEAVMCYVFFLLTWCCIDLFVSFVYIVFIKKEDIFNNYNNSTKYLVESEKEIASVDDIIPLMAGFISMFCFFFLASNYIVSEPYSLNGIFCISFPCFFFFVICMPINLVYDGGAHTSFFLRGACNTTIFLLEFLYDILCTTIMFIRLFIQNIRFILMFFAFLEICEYIYNNTFFEYYLYCDTKITFLKVFEKSFYTSILLNLEIFFNTILFYFYNIAHLLYETLSHFFAYIILVFWFFFFLYTTFLHNKMEKYFKIIIR